jgi:hypothetical protein
MEYAYCQTNPQSGTMDILRYEGQWMEECNKSHIDETTLTERNLKIYYCPNFFPNTTLGGYWDYTTSAYLTVYMVPCNKDVETGRGIKCATDEEKKRYFNNEFYIDMQMDNMIIDPTNYNKPISRSISYSYSAIDSSINKIKEYYYTLTTLTTDSGWILTDEHSQQTLVITNTLTDSSNIYENGAVFTVRVYITQQKTNISRKYLKIQDIFASVGSFMKLIFLMVKYVCIIFYQRIKYSKYLFDKILEFPKQDSKTDFRRSSVLNFIGDKFELKLKKENNIDIVSQPKSVTPLKIPKNQFELMTNVEINAANPIRFSEAFCYKLRGKTNNFLVKNSFQVLEKKFDIVQIFSNIQSLNKAALFSMGEAPHEIIKNCNKTKIYLTLEPDQEKNNHIIIAKYLSSKLVQSSLTENDKMLFESMALKSKLDVVEYIKKEKLLP